MAKVSYHNVRWMRLTQIAALWHRELRLPENAVLDELRLGIINVPRVLNGKGWIKTLPPEHELPSPNERVNREWLMTFCHKQEWPYPRFWFPEEYQAQRPGRPSLRDAIVQEFERRVAAGRTEAKISSEARALAVWAQGQFGPDAPNPKTIQAHIRNHCRHTSPGGSNL